MPFTLIGTDGPGDLVPESWIMPDVQGDWVVWQQSLDSAVDWNVYAYNLKSRATKPLSTATGTQSNPRVYGNWAVWEDFRWGNCEVYAYNLSANQEKRLTNRAGDQRYPAIWGTKVVYADAASGDVYLYDLAKGTETVLPLGAGTQTVPGISDRRVVYQQSTQIYVYDMTNGSIAQLTASGTNIHPDIDGTLVAWQRVGANMDVWSQDLAGGVAAPAASSSDDESFPRVSGKHIVYVRNVGGSNYNICLYDKVLNDWELLTNATTDELQPAIDGLNVVYTSNWLAAGANGGDVALGRLIAPSFSVKAASSVVPYGGHTVISGTLAENGIALGLVPIAIDRSTNAGHTWVQVATRTTSAGGAWGFTTPGLSSKVWYRAHYHGRFYFVQTVDHFSAVSAAVSVTPRASVGKPAGYPKSGRKTKTYSVYGSLQPKQTPSAASAKAVVIQCYRKKSGTWVWHHTVNARVYNYSTYSRYSAGVKLPHAGRWRIRGYFKGSSINAAHYSTYRYTTVD